jgi:hypothetical protein
MANRRSENDKKCKERKMRPEMKRALSEVKATVASGTSFIVSALTLVAGLAWNDVAKGLFERLKERFSGWGETIGLVIYASVVTVIAVLLIRRLRKIQEVVGGKSIKKASKKVK